MKRFKKPLIVVSLIALLSWSSFMLWNYYREQQRIDFVVQVHTDLANQDSEKVYEQYVCEGYKTLFDENSFINLVENSYTDATEDFNQIESVGRGDVLMYKIIEEQKTYFYQVKNDSGLCINSIQGF